MIIALNDINFNVNLYPFSGNDNFVFLLHGFTGSGKDWEIIVKNLDKKFNYITVDLPGHGLSESPPEAAIYSPDALTSQLNELVAHFTKKKIILIGYSMGGRAALLYTVRNPGKVRGLILEGATAGIKEDSTRKLRKADDENLAEFIEKHTIEEFVDHWMNLDIFKSQKKIPDKLNRIREEKIKNSKTGLANSLKGFSTGSMPVLYDQLKNIGCRTLLVSGELDTKYTRLNSEMQALIPYSRHISVPGAGHNVHMEKPELFINAVNEFLGIY